MIEHTDWRDRIATMVRSGEADGWPIDPCCEGVDEYPLETIPGEWVVRIGADVEFPCGVGCCGLSYHGSRTVPAHLLETTP